MTGIVPPEFSRPVEADPLPALGRAYEIVATDAERAAVAHRLGLEEVRRLAGAFNLVPHSRRLVAVTGQIEAEVVQNCVVTLQPLVVTVREPVERLFAPGEPADEPAGEPVAEAIVATDDDPPDHMIDGIIDLGELTVEQLALGLDPYPRAPGAVFDSDGGSAPDAAAGRPFAALSKLKSSMKTES